MYTYNNLHMMDTINKKVATENDIKVIKNKLVNILLKNSNQDKVLDIILDAVNRTNKIVIHTCQFLKSYLIEFNYNHPNIPFPRIDRQFIKLIMNIVSVKKDGRGARYSPGMLNTVTILQNFNENIYKKLRSNGDEVCDNLLGQILAYEADIIITNIENNIAQHYIQHLKNLINIKFELKNKLSEANKEKDKVLKKKLVSEIYTELKHIKDDLMSAKHAKLTSLKKYHGWINKHKQTLTPNKIVYSMKSINYDVCAKPMDYLKCMFYINKELASLGTKDDPVKLFHVLPLRTNIVSKYITLDTDTMVRLFSSIIKQFISNIIEKENENKNETDKQELITSVAALADLSKHEDNIWKSIFKLDHSFFKKKSKYGYKFHHMIKTDGMACSVLYSKSVPKKSKKEKMIEPYPYIESFTPEQIKEILKDGYVVDDPNKEDAAYCMGSDCLDENGEKNQNGSTFRYTQNQRRKEIGLKRYSKILDGLNHRQLIDVISNQAGKIKTIQKSVKEVEASLSSFNSKTCDRDGFFNYVQRKNYVNRLLYEHYNKPIFRKFKWNRYMNTQRSESKMVNNFEVNFGPPEETVVIIGDYDCKGAHMKGKEPILNKRIKTKLSNRGYKICLINEFRTSKTCNKCHHDVENFKVSPSKKPKNIKLGKETVVWGLVRCTNVNCTPSTIPKGPITEQDTHTSMYNRDMNACMNMLKILKSLLAGTGRPAIFCRQPPIIL